MHNLQQVLDESINFELDAFQLYNLFSETFADEYDFWNELAEEELNHTSVLRKIKQFYQGDTSILDLVSVKDYDVVIEARKNLKELRAKFTKEPSQNLAYEIALTIESSMVEESYQKFMSKVTDNTVIQLFQSLNGDDKNHFKRIQNHFKNKF